MVLFSIAVSLSVLAFLVIGHGGFP
jgi:hypothetical protein